MRNGSFDCRGNSSRHDDASCWRFSHMSPSSCSSSWSLEQERTNSSAPRDCTNLETTSARLHKKRDVIGSPLLPLSRAICNLLPPRVTISSTFSPDDFITSRSYFEPACKNSLLDYSFGVKIDIILKAAYHCFRKRNLRTEKKICQTFSCSHWAIITPKGI